MTYDELTSTLPPALADAFILAPGYIGADSLDLETYIETVWKAPVTVENYKAVAQSVRQWYREHCPDEYHDPPREFPGVGGGWGGYRIRPPGSKPAGRKTINPKGAQTKPTTIRLDPDVYKAVMAYAGANRVSFNAALNALLEERNMSYVIAFRNQNKSTASSYDTTDYPTEQAAVAAMLEQYPTQQRVDTETGKSEFVFVAKREEVNR
jgi:hypothetical protein